MRVVNPETAPTSTGYSQAAVMGEIVFVSGQVAVDREGALVGKDDPVAQAEQVFTNLQTVLQGCGSDLDKVGKLTVYLTKIEYRAAVVEVRNRIYEPLGFFPASTLAVVAGLARPEWLIEIEAVAGM